jgi:phosphate uptake regulator
MNFAALALDYDGAIAVDGVFDPSVRQAIGDARQRGTCRRPSRAIVHDSLQAFREEDTERAHAVMNRDDQVDALNAQTFRQLLEHPAADAQSRARDMRLILFARSLERVADHATNVCEEVFYLVQGADVRHPELR